MYSSASAGWRTASRHKQAARAARARFGSLMCAYDEAAEKSSRAPESASAMRNENAARDTAGAQPRTVLGVELLRRGVPQKRLKVKRSLVAARAALDDGSDTGGREQRKRSRATVLISKRGFKVAHSALCMRAPRSEKRADCSSGCIGTAGTQDGDCRLCKQINCAVCVSCGSGEHFNRFVHAAQAAESVDAQEPRREACSSTF